MCKKKFDRKQTGRIGLTMAINYFTLQGYTISLPINDTQWYDLIVEKDNKFLTVQCKATMRDDNGIDFRCTGGTKGKVFDNILNHPIDILFCVNKDLKCWSIPFIDVKNSNVHNTIYLRETISKSRTGFQTYQYLIK